MGLRILILIVFTLCTPFLAHSQQRSANDKTMSLRGIVSGRQPTLWWSLEYGWICFHAPQRALGWQSMQ